MGKDITHWLLLSWLVFFNATCNASSNYDYLISISYKERKAGFGGLEHRDLGENTTLKWGHLPHSLANNHLQLSNGLIVSYGELIMYAGDFFGNQNYPISTCRSKNKSSCFYKQFFTLDQSQTNPYKNALTQIPKYRRYFNELSNSLKQAKVEGESEWEFYIKHGSDISKTLNRLSGGGSVISDYIPFGEYIKLANVNYDHFVPNALSAYRTGHKLALETAIKAHIADLSGDTDQAHNLLTKAYVMNGFSNHYLTDAMSTGHFRTPRLEIVKHVFLPKALCLLIANLMHDEDNRIGLNVTNQRGISWHAYGDGHLNMPEASQHLALIQQVVQESVNAIYEAFESGKMPEHFDEMTILPDYSNISQLNNHPPLFKWENNQLLKRKHNFDINDNHYTAWWSGLITLMEFNHHDWNTKA